MYSIPSHKLDAEYPCVSRLGQSAAVNPASCARSLTRAIFSVATNVVRLSPAAYLVTAAAEPGFPKRVQQPRRAVRPPRGHRGAGRRGCGRPRAGVTRQCHHRDVTGHAPLRGPFFRPRVF